MHSLELSVSDEWMRVYGKSLRKIVQDLSPQGAAVGQQIEEVSSALFGWNVSLLAEHPDHFWAFSEKGSQAALLWVFLCVTSKVFAALVSLFILLSFIRPDAVC